MRPGARRRDGSRPRQDRREIVHLDHGVAQGVSALDHGVFLVGQAAGRIGGVGDVAHVGLRIAVQRAALFQLADLGLDGFGLQRGGQRQFDGAYRLVGGGGQVAAGGQAITGGARVDQQLGDLLAQFVRGQRLRMAPGEDDAAQAPGDEAVRVVFQHAVEGFLQAEQRVLDRPVRQRRIGGLAAFVLVALERGADQVHLRQDVAQARGQALAALQAAAQHQHGGVCQQREGSAVAAELLVVTLHLGRDVGVHADQAGAGQRGAQRAQLVLHDEAHVAPEGAVEVMQTLLAVGRLRGLHLGQHVGMAADRALAEDDQAAGQDVGAFHGDADGNLLVGAAQEVGRSQADALASDHVHAVVDDLARALGDVVFDDGGDDRGLFAQVHRAGGHAARGVHHVGVAADARQRFLDALELAHRCAELAAHAGIGAHGAGGQLGHAGVGGRQRDRAAGGQAFHQHAPALAGHGGAADDEVQRHEHVLAARRAVHEHGVQREVAAARVHAGVVVRHQRAGDARSFSSPSSPSGSYRRNAKPSRVQTGASVM